MGSANDNQLRKIVKGMQVVADTVNSENPHIMISDFVHVGRLFVTVNLGFPEGIIFKKIDSFISERVKQVTDKAINSDETVKSLLDRDIAKKPEPVDNGSRCVLRLLRISRMFTVTFEEILNEGTSLPQAILFAYRKVWATYHNEQHGGFVLKVVDEVPSLSQVRNALNEDEDSLNELMHKYVEASNVVINYIEDLFRANEVSRAYLLKI